ncbi:MAG TPA: MCE family protein [Actinomycetota bacterium]|nr:MCE family protein [Actinomycetota bacterium]
MIRRLVSIVVIVAALGSGLFAFSSAQEGTGAYTITADVEQAPNLFSNGRVMVRGVEVGRIADVDPRAEGVRLTLEIQAGVKIPTGATLAVVPITVISDRYVQLFPAYSSGPAMEDGDHIALADTRIPAELDDVLTQLQGLLSALEPRPGEERGPLADLIEGLDEVVSGRAKELRGTLRKSSSVLENLANSDSDITRLIQNLDTLFVSLANRSSEIGLLNERLQLVFEALQGDQEELEGTIENLAFLADEAALLVSGSGDDLGSSFGRLDRVLRAVLRREDDLLRATQWTNVIAQALGATDGRGRGLYAYTGRRAPAGTDGAAYNYRIDTRDTIACERIDALIQSFLVLNPEATVEQLRETLFTFIPDEFDDDIAYLVDLLIPLCANLPDRPGQSLLDERAQEIVRDVADEIGEEAFAALLSRWFFEGLES